MSSRTERLTFGFGFAVIAILALLLFPAWKSYNDARPEAVPAPAVVDSATPVRNTPRQAPRPTRTPEVMERPATRVAPTPAPTHSTAPARKPPTLAKLALKAARGDCWVEVRSGSATGESLFVGTLATGSAKTFSAKILWIRFGAPETLDLTLNGKAATIPAGTVNVVVTPRGLRSA